MDAPTAAARNQTDPATITTRVSLAELLSRSLEEDPTVDEPLAERFDDDEGSSGG
jgi:hypothetical protein